MNLTTWDPFREFDSLSRDLFGLSNFASASNVPATDIYTVNDTELVVEAHLPNFKEEDISIDISQGALDIRAQHSEKVEDKERKYVMRESSTSFYRRIGLPKNIDENGIEATFQDGVLKVRLPYKELPEPKRVKIGIGKGGQGRSALKRGKDKSKEE